MPQKGARNVTKRHVFLFVINAIAITVLAIFAFRHWGFLVRAIDPIDDIQSQIDQIAHLRDLSVQATTPLQSQVKDLDGRISKAQASIKTMQAQTNDLSKTISDQELQLASQYKLFAQRVEARYKKFVLRCQLQLLI